MKISVIIPTMATCQRSSLLKRAIQSIRKSSSSPTRIIVVVNGEKFDEDTYKWLKEQPDITLDLLSVPSAPKAVLRGRELVETEYFSTLDDDDEFLQFATDERLAFLESNKSSDLVITNGYRNNDEKDVLWHSNLSHAGLNPIESLMDANWLASCNALYRTKSVGPDFFRDSHPYGEWTWLAYRLALSGKRVGVLDKPTFRINDTANSLSKSQEYERSYISLFLRMLSLCPPSHIVPLISRKLGAAYHDAADSALRNGYWVKALGWHFKSILEKDGYRYVPFSRYFIIPIRID